MPLLFGIWPAWYVLLILAGLIPFCIGLHDDLTSRDDDGEAE